MSKAETSAVIFGVGPRQGLGAELCHRAAARGLHVFVNGRTAEKIDAVVADIETAGGSASALLADVTDEKAVNAAVAEIEKDGRPLELAIYNAGNNRPEKFLDVTAEVFEDMWKVICFGGFLAAQAVVPLMLKQSTARRGKACCLLERVVPCAAKLGSPLLLPERAHCV